MVIKRSLTKQLHGGNIKIGLKKSNTSRGATNNGSSKDYSTFLNQMKSFKKNIPIKNKPRSSKKKHNTNKTREIIPQEIIPQKIIPQKIIPQKIIPQKIIPQKIIPQKITKQPVKAQPVKAQSLKKRKPKLINGSRSKINKLKKSFTKNKLKRRSYRKINPKRKNIVVSMPQKIDSKNVDEIHKKIKEIKEKSKDEMIKELNKNGVKTSGKDVNIIRDIYLYSKLCGINITK